MSQITVHTSQLFDPKQKKVLDNISITVDRVTGCIVKVFGRPDETLSRAPEDIDLRGLFVMPGLVDAQYEFQSQELTFEVLLLGLIRI